MSDYFVEHPPQQPKREICDYLESEGIRVPARIANLQDALRDGHKFLMRSEHPQDYDGASDLLKSISFDPEKDVHPGLKQLEGQEKIVQNVLNDSDTYDEYYIQGHLPKLSQECAEMLLSYTASNRTKFYCSLMSNSHDDFLKNVSYSYWEYIDGCNHTVIADSAIHNRYHLFSYLYKPKEKRLIMSYIISDNNKLSEQAHRTDESVIARVPRLINLYESVRNLPRFNSNHCPIVEMHTTDDEVDYCLQVHRTQDFAESTFDLGTIPQEETYFCRGATPNIGEVYQISCLVDYEDQIAPKEYMPYEGAYLLSDSPGFLESHVKMRGVNLSDTKKQSKHYAAKLAASHTSRSELFKSPVYIQLPLDDITSDNEWRAMMDNPSFSVPVKITSDGRKAIVERV